MTQHAGGRLANCLEEVYPRTMSPSDEAASRPCRAKGPEVGPVTLADTLPARRGRSRGLSTASIRWASPLDNLTEVHRDAAQYSPQCHRGWCRNRRRSRLATLGFIRHIEPDHVGGPAPLSVRGAAPPALSALPARLLHAMTSRVIHTLDMVSSFSVEAQYQAYGAARKAAANFDGPTHAVSR